jgi:hypothetical protein
MASHEPLTFEAAYLCPVDNRTDLASAESGLSRLEGEPNPWMNRDGLENRWISAIPSPAAND